MHIYQLSSSNTQYSVKPQLKYYFYWSRSRHSLTVSFGSKFKMAENGADCAVRLTNISRDVSLSYIRLPPSDIN
ncbi:unnamed protein product [Acanthoscelides obtectus]|uniref:Uncharacterized protein n=1 Tax=Acanthoscelides obtectus TaxID=200917 RepID=A0A9P0JJC5_ACAOB|nr:unnamed protein product [Acanthoscelides obtectus]CAK1654344.1 hypothetical protein AOBTE_LOCUS18534 [Acanthoscelides obtectus]